MRRELVALVVECGPLGCEFFDTCLCGGDDRVAGVVVFFEAEALATNGLVDLDELSRDRGEFCRVVVVDCAEGS
jgi:hypothetical protein